MDHKKLLFNNGGGIIFPPTTEGLLSVDDYIAHVNGIGFSNVKVTKVDDNSFRYTGGGNWQVLNLIGKYTSEKSLKLIPNAKYSLRFTAEYSKVYIVSPTADLKPVYNSAAYEYIFTCDSTGEIMTMVNGANTSLISSVILTLLKEPPQTEWEELEVGTGSDYGKITPIPLFNNDVPPNDELLAELEAVSYRTTTTAPSVSFYTTTAHNTGKSVTTTLSLVKDETYEFRIYHVSNYNIRVDWKVKGVGNWGSGSVNMSTGKYSALYRINDMKSIKIKKYI